MTVNVDADNAPPPRLVRIGGSGELRTTLSYTVGARDDWEHESLIWRPVWLYDLANWSDPALKLGEQHTSLRTKITDELRSLIAGDVVRVASADPDVRPR